MKILLTGFNGFLGKSIISDISLSNKLIFLSRTCGDYQLSLESQIPKFTDNFDLVIHAAGKAHNVPQTKEMKALFYSINVEGTKNLLIGLESTELPKQFVFISTVSVYGLSNGLEISENAPLLAKDPYGLSKIQAEKIVLDWCKRKNVICTILRLPLLIGPNAPGNFGAMVKGIKNGYYFNIAGGKANKSMVLAEDVAKSILKVAKFGGTYNLTDGYHPTFNELSRVISLQLGKKFVYNMPLFLAKILANIGDLVGDKFPINSNKLSKIVSPLTFDDSNARRTFGWNPRPVLKQLKIKGNS